MATMCAQVPFSTFVQNVRSNEVLAVAVEDRRFAYKLRPKGKIMRGLPAGPNDVVRWSMLHSVLCNITRSCTKSVLHVPKDMPGNCCMRQATSAQLSLGICNTGCC